MVEKEPEDFRILSRANRLEDELTPTPDKFFTSNILQQTLSRNYLWDGTKWIKQAYGLPHMVKSGTVTVASGATETIIEVKGKMEFLEGLLYTDYNQMHGKVYGDGKLIFDDTVKTVWDGNIQLPAWQVTRYDTTNNDYNFQGGQNANLAESFKIDVTHSSGTNQAVVAKVLIASKGKKFKVVTGTAQ